MRLSPLRIRFGNGGFMEKTGLRRANIQTCGAHYDLCLSDRSRRKTRVDAFLLPSFEYIAARGDPLRFRLFDLCGIAFHLQANPLFENFLLSQQEAQAVFRGKKLRFAPPPIKQTIG